MEWQPAIRRCREMMHFEAETGVDLAKLMGLKILRGTTREKVNYMGFPFPDGSLCLPDFYLEQTPVGK